jgi:catechol 2,3-dioxygenase-like lactoylglutathione lyase family enzyme
MRMIPLFRVTDMNGAIHFYTQVLDFRVKDPSASADDWVVILENGDADLMLTKLEFDQKIGISTNVLVSEVDKLFKKYKDRGLDQPFKENSPVHQGPIDQSWGTREFYVTDPDGNTLRFVQW